MGKLLKIIKNYSRDEIDSLGTIRILKEPKWKTSLPDQELASDVEYEKDFVESSDNFATAAYLANNQCYNRKGDMLLKPSNLEDWSTGEFISVRCPHIPSACEMATLVRKVKHQQDSTGGIIHCIVGNVPVGLGEPCFDKLQAKLAHAMLSIPAVKGFEIGSGFAGTRLLGSQHNDPFCVDSNSGMITVSKNDAGGVLGGISSGAEIYFRVAIKPVTSIGQVQRTVDFDGNETVLHVEGRHDPCVLPRAVPLVEAMTALVLADLAMLQFARM